MTHCRAAAIFVLRKRAGALAVWVSAAFWCVSSAGQQYYRSGVRTLPYPVAPTPMASGFAPVANIPGTNVSIHMGAVGNRLLLTCPHSGRSQLGFSSRHGLQLQIELTPAPQFGYQPIRFTLRTRQPVAADREIRIAFHAGSWGYRSRSMTLVQRVTIAQGEREASVSAFVAQYQDWPLCGWEVDVDGRKDEELSINQVPFSHQQSAYGVSAIMVAEKGGTRPNQSALQSLTNVAFSQVRDVDELPAEWIEYSGYDIVTFDANLLAKVAAREPRRFEALVRWVRSGGNLWILDCGDDWNRLRMAEGALPFRSSNATSTEAEDADILRRGWQFAPLNDRSLDPIEGALLLSGYDLGDSDAPKLSTSQATTAGQVLQTLIAAANGRQVTSAQVFTVRGLGLGCVAAFRADGSHLMRDDAILAVQQSVLMPRITAVNRFGNKPDEANSEFNNWLIPGVGVAPVGMFQFLITLFVMIIGPLNYWWLKRRKKLPLLLATVPAAAAAATILLLGYGTLSDGLKTRVRARSLTLIDQVAGEATSWGRLSYFAGMQPRSGLTFPTDVAVYPVLSSWSMGRYGNFREVERTMSWEQNQRLTSGWLPTRTPTQYLTVSSRASKKRLDVKPVPGGVQVDNRLGVHVTHLVVQDHNGKLFWLTDLAPGQRKIAVEADALEVSGDIRQLFSDHYPEYPPGADPNAYSGGYSASALSQGLLEANLEAINSPLVERWIDGSYIAVTESGVELDLGLEGVQEEASFHVVRGLW